MSTRVHSPSGLGHAREPAVTPDGLPPSLRRLVGGRWLRCGYTTGTCAAAATKAAATMLVTGRPVDEVRLDTPGGVGLVLDVLDASFDQARASCAVRKDGGDDPDATDGALIYAAVEPAPGEGITIDGGEGIGRVTRPGLDQPVGAAAINSTPRRMIEQALREAGQADRGWRVRISCPTGEQIAAKTFNPKLGIVGGISILGTSGLVEPMSHAALVETTAREISVLAAAGIKDLLVLIGNYGETFARDSLGLSLDPNPDADPDPNRLGYGVVKSSNFIGDVVAQAAGGGFERVLVVGHLGKLVKLGIGLLNTHSSQGDGRMETLLACALEAGAGLGVLRQLLGCVSTDAAAALLGQAGLLDETMAVLERRIQATFDRHVPAELHLHWICFARLNGAFDLVARSTDALEPIRKWAGP